MARTLSHIASQFALPPPPGHHPSGSGDAIACPGLRTFLHLSSLGAIALAALLTPSISNAAVVEEVIAVPVALRTIFGDRRQDIVVTVFHDDERPRSPYLVLNHGRTSSESERAAVGRKRYFEISKSSPAIRKRGSRRLKTFCAILASS
jgi:hypothetical protein